MQSPILEGAQNEDSNIQTRSLGNFGEKSEGYIVAIFYHQGHEHVLPVERAGIILAWKLGSLGKLW